MGRPIPRPVSPFVRYILAAPWPHATAAVSLCFAVLLTIWAMYLESGGEYESGGVICLWAVFWLVVAFFAGADGISRNREYARIFLLFERYGFRKRILECAVKSRCQRDAALRAARDAGYGIQAEKYYRELGYRWYHVLPDAAYRNPFVFLSPHYLRTSFLPGKQVRRESRQRMRSK